MYHKTYI